MIFDKVLGHYHEQDKKKVVKIPVEWYEVDKKILRKTTSEGEEIGIKLIEKTKLKEGDILEETEEKIYIIEIVPCDVIEIAPTTMSMMAHVAFEIGNQHKPLFVNNEKVYVAYDKPLFELLESKHFHPNKTVAKLMGEVSCHGHKH